MSASVDTSVATVPLAGGVFDRDDELNAARHQRVVFCQDDATGLRAIIAIHDTTLGPALGGTRMYPYRSEAEALTDVLRLSQGMTFKAAAAGLGLGGGKAVIIGGQDLKTPELLRAYGRFVDDLAGRYYTAADVGTTADDLDEIASTTPYVVGTNVRGSGDSGGSTALGVFHAMRTAAESVFGAEGLRGRRVGVEGVGKVGARLVDLLAEAGVAEVLVTDPDAEAVRRLTGRHAVVRPATGVVDAPVDVYAPCALGATLTRQTVERLQAAVVCGGANNQLRDASVADELARRGIVWVPDYIANAGGLIQVGSELTDSTAEEVRAKVAAISGTVAQVIELAQRDGVSTSAAASTIVQARLANGRDRSR